MKKFVLTAICCAVLAACSANGGSQNQMYGEVGGGVESSKSF